MNLGAGHGDQGTRGLDCPLGQCGIWIMGRAILVISGSAISLLPRPFAAVGSIFAVFWRELTRDAVRPYRPELHYMRGPGPAWRAKHGLPPAGTPYLFGCPAVNCAARKGAYAGSFRGMVRAAILDDYQNVAMGLADWSPIAKDVEIKVFNKPFASQDEAIKALQGFAIVVGMRERTPFPRKVIEALPDLKLLITTGARNNSFDVKTCSERGVTVCGTGGV